MRSRQSLRSWTAQLLPAATPVAQHAAAHLLRALLTGFTTNLSQLARQLDRLGTAKVARQWLQRWLDRPGFAPEQLYAYLVRLVPQAAWDQPQVLLLIDVTTLGDRWAVLQVSIPWQRRALPVWRLVYPTNGSEGAQTAGVKAALEGLKRSLPGPQDLFVVVMDRGFPSHALIRYLQQEGWRFVLRVQGTWRVEHPQHRGRFRDALGSPAPVLLAGARLGYGAKGRNRHSQANVVFFHGAGHADAWFLITSEADAAEAVAMYRRRMQIEQEFRDLKGPFGLDALASWEDLQRVAAFLAWVAVYEWRLAFLWVTHQLEGFREESRVAGRLSWIRTTREWIGRQLRLAGPLPDLRL